jgi:hypothetical protein
MPKIFDDPSEKKTYGIGIKQKYMTLADNNGLNINDYIATLFDIISKKEDQYKAMQFELLTLENTFREAVGLSSDEYALKKTKEILDAEPPEI